MSDKFQCPEHLAEQRDFFLRLDQVDVRVRGIFLCDENEQLRRYLWKYNLDPGVKFPTLTMREAQRAYAMKIFSENNGEIKSAAQTLGIYRTTLNRILGKLNGQRQIVRTILYLALLLPLTASADKLGSARGGAAQLLKRTAVTSVPPKLPPIPPLRPLPNRRLAMISLKPVTLAWDGVINATSYKLCWGTQSGLYDNRVIFTNTTATIALVPNQTYYLAVSALGANGLESVLSTELVYTVPPAVSTVTITVTIEGADGVAGPWRAVDLPVTRTEQTTNTQRYYRAVMQIGR